jgi:hypothetical protein
MLFYTVLLTAHTHIYKNMYLHKYIIVDLKCCVLPHSILGLSHLSTPQNVLDGALIQVWPKWVIICTDNCKPTERVHCGGRA